ncbi:MAG: hypothetical protein ACI4QY_05430 [Oscillospiraceae bacterium]
MSLKSFDKFCEKMILAEPGSEKEIFDERQKQIQVHLVIQAMVCFILLMLAHCIVSDLIYKWSESNLVPFLLFAMISVIFYIIRAGIMGCYIGVNGAVARYIPAGMCIAMGILNGFRAFLKLYEGEFAAVKNGVVADSFLELCSWLLMMVSGILTIHFIKKSEKESEKDSEKGT